MYLYDKGRNRVNIVTIRPTGRTEKGPVEQGACVRAHP